MSNKYSLSLPGLFGLIMTLSMITACNKDSESTSYQAAPNLAVTAFSLSADSKNPGLDSTYFSIDLNHGVIFNADSLRKGTKIDKVVPKITFSSVVTEAVFVMTGGTTRQGEVNFQENPTDSIDFTGDVTLRISADNGQISKTYRVKVNVHKENPDTLIWNDIANHSFPTRLPSPKAMKTLENDGKLTSMIEESDGSLSLARLESLESFDWDTSELSLPFTPQVRTFNMTDDAAWLLADNGDLWKGTSTLDAWENTGMNWELLIGVYTNTVVGLRNDDGRHYFAQYPQADLGVKEAPEGFPLRGLSNFVTLKNEWTSSPVAFFTGGITASGAYSDTTWAFDGKEWIRLSMGGIPGLQGASIIPYYNFRPSADGKSKTEYKVWMLTGGLRENGELNRTVYVSYDNGVNWATGVSTLQLPQEIPALMDCDNIVSNIEYKANLADGWTRTSRPARVNFWTQGDYVIWECPYIFLIGGRLPDGSLSTKIWRGVLNRYTFMPII